MLSLATFAGLPVRISWRNYHIFPFKTKFVVHWWPESTDQAVNSHDTRRLYPPRYEITVYCQDIYYGVLECLYVKYDINYVFLVPKKFDSWSKNVISGQFSVHFWWNFRRKILFGKILLHQKIRLWISGALSRAIFELSCSFPPLSAV